MYVLNKKELTMDSLTDGFKLMAIGMGMVFLFLSIMVWAIALMAKLLEPYKHLLADESLSVSSKTNIAKNAQNNKSNDVISAIVAAVHKYRSEH